ncbi:MAG: 30S ribosomal protein S17 [Myxococcales bacterium]|nr:MAG: 30S ribosomal protein S17 [Myxococcales bacterium]
MNSPLNTAQSAKATEPTTERGSRRRLSGRVVNDTSNPKRAQKTVVVEVVRRFRDPVYGKYVKRRKRYHAHDETNTYQTRDLVEIKESRPLSATKRWIVTRLLERPEEV